MHASPPSTAEGLRAAWDEYWSARGHAIVPSASTVPTDRTVLFTIAGMIPFKPYFVGEEQAPWPRAASIQKCVRAGGKHNDLDDIGRTNRHFSFFEMMGFFSFGDYFKADAIPWAWTFFTEVMGLDPERLWVTIHTTDDDAARIWTDDVGFPPARLQRLDEDNFWRMGDTGPCGPSSEIHYDLGPEHGPDGGPAVAGGDRFVEVGNIVFMQYDQRADGTRADLPKPSIDFGMGFERLLFLVQGKESIFDIDLFQPLIARAEQVTGTRYGDDPEHDVYLRILAEHARTMAFIVSDGVMPSNQERGYVLRRIIRRAVRHAYLLGARDLVTPPMIDAVCEVMGSAYPKLIADREIVTSIVAHEEQSFLVTLQRGTEHLDGLLDRGDVSGDDAFYLHDTLGFPVDLTREIASERGRQVDVAAFDARMTEQRERAREAAKEAGGRANAPVELYREIVGEHGTTEFTGREEYTTDGARVLALADGRERMLRAAGGDAMEVILDRTPFYAESGGQVGDTGMLRSERGAVAEVQDTQYGLPGLVVHRVGVIEGELSEGDIVTAAIDGERRDNIRRNHTATHLLHWALREVLGPHVKQAGSVVEPGRLRFDFSHYEAVPIDDLVKVETLANEQVISDAPVTHIEMAKADAEARGAIAFFGDKYGDRVRVLDAGPSIELCGGTHVDSLGFIGPIKIVSEGSIGSNVRRIEALTGDGSIAYISDEEARLRRIAAQLRATPAEVEERVTRLQGQLRELESELRSLRAEQATAAAGDLAAGAEGGVLVARRDGATPDELRQLAHAVLTTLPDGGVVALLGAGPDGAKASIVVAVSKQLVADGASAAEIAAPGARAIGGGTGKNADLAMGGGPNVAAIDSALELVGEQAGRWRR
jgi:alanyl-tRNA synthetase